jgi:hypothetical protein
MGAFYLPPESDNLNEVPASFTRLSYADDKVTYLGDSVSNINLHVDTDFRNMRACVSRPPVALDRSLHTVKTRL